MERCRRIFRVRRGPAHRDVAKLPAARAALSRRLLRVHEGHGRHRQLARTSPRDRVGTGAGRCVRRGARRVTRRGRPHAGRHDSPVAGARCPAATYARGIGAGGDRSVELSPGGLPPRRGAHQGVHPIGRRVSGVARSAHVGAPRFRHDHALSRAPGAQSVAVHVSPRARRHGTGGQLTRAAGARGRRPSHRTSHRRHTSTRQDGGRRCGARRRTAGGREGARRACHAGRSGPQ